MQTNSIWRRTAPIVEWEWMRNRSKCMWNESNWRGNINGIAVAVPVPTNTINITACVIIISIVNGAFACNELLLEDCK